MTEEIVYMLGIVGIGFAVNYTLRALPFLLFSGRNRALPPAVERFGRLLSPVIIGLLIVYAYSCSAWRTPWPYLAGALTVGLQVWKRNPLTSIVAGTVLYMCLLNCGCATRPAVTLDSKTPSFRVTETELYCGEDPIRLDELTDILEDNEVAKTTTIHILLDSETRDLRVAKLVMAYLAKSGYTRPVLVTARHGESFSTGKRPPRKAAVRPSAPEEPKAIRYKRASE